MQTKKPLYFNLQVNTRGHISRTSPSGSNRQLHSCVLKHFLQYMVPWGVLFLLQLLCSMCLCRTEWEQVGSLHVGPQPRDGDWRQLWTSSAAHLFYIFPLAVEFDEVDLILFPWYATGDAVCSPPAQDRNVSQCFIFQAFIFPF